MDPIKPIFFSARCLRRLNKKYGTKMTMTDIRMLYFLRQIGPQTERGLCCLNVWYRVKLMIQRLEEYHLIAFNKREKYEITIDGMMRLEIFEKMLKNARFREGSTNFN